MAACTGVRCIGVIAVVAGRTIIGYGDVSARERIVIIVIDKGGWRPTGGSGMARSTIG